MCVIQWAGRALWGRVAVAAIRGGRTREKEQTTEKKLSNVVFHPSYFDEVANLQRVNDDIGQDIANFLMVD